MFAFTRPAATSAAQSFARELGAVWAGASEEPPPQQLDAAIIFAPVGALVPLALRALAPGGTVVCGGIHMSDIPSLPLQHPVAGARRCARSRTSRAATAEELLELAPRAGVRDPRHHAIRSTRANEALEDLRAGRFTGAAVLVP